jgi:hypothetical protein
MNKEMGQNYFWDWPAKIQCGGEKFGFAASLTGN